MALESRWEPKGDQGKVRESKTKDRVSKGARTECTGLAEDTEKPFSEEVVGLGHT